MIYKNEKVKEFIDYCSKNNINIYLVGGATRDYLSNIECFDLDFSLVSDYDEAKNLLKKKYNIKFDDKYQSIKFEIDKYNIEISHARKERDYLDFRHPSVIEFTDSIREDSKRRDFTINAIYYKDDKYEDFHNGIEDLKNKRLRVIGDILTRFKEDPLRILRMIRFSINYEISKEDERVIKDNVYLLKELTEASFNKEFDKLLGLNNLYVLYEYKEVFESYFDIKFPDLLILNKLTSLSEKKTYLGIKNKSNLYKYKDVVIPNDRVELNKLIYKLGKEVVSELVLYSDKVNDTHLEELFNEITSDGYYSKDQLTLTSHEIIEITNKESLTSYYIDELSYAIIEGKISNTQNELIMYLKKLINK